MTDWKATAMENAAALAYQAKKAERLEARVADLERKSRAMKAAGQMGYYAMEAERDEARGKAREYYERLEAWSEGRHDFGDADATEHPWLREVHPKEDGLAGE